MSQQMLDRAADVVKAAQKLGASEVTAAIAEGSHTELSRRDGKVEQASESSTRRLAITLLVDDKWSSHSTSDLRPDALQAFLTRAVDATRVLEPDPDRRLAPAELCGRGATDAELDTFDPRFETWSASDRAVLAQDLEDAVRASAPDSLVSATVGISDGSGRSAQVTSHGFADSSAGAWFSAGTNVTLSDEGGRRPEGSAHYAARYLDDLPDPAAIATEVHHRADEAVGSGPIASGTYPMLLLNRVAGRILGTLSQPLSGGAIHHGRSCLADKRGEAIASSELTLLDDPTIPRGLGSTPWDGDLMVAQPRTIVERGVLQQFYLDTYYARRLGEAPTTGGRTNWVIAPGTQSWTELAASLPKAILVTGFLGGNANPLTGDFSFGIRGRLLEHGQPTAKLSEMNVAGNVLTIFHKLAARADDVWTHSATRVPTLLFEDVQFSGT